MSYLNVEKRGDSSKHSLHQSLIGLYLSVKVRSKQEVENYTTEQQEAEEVALQETSPFLIIDYIKSSIDILLNCQMEKAMQINEAKKEEARREETNESSYQQDGSPHELEKLTQGLEAEVRLHIRVRNLLTFSRRNNNKDCVSRHLRR